ncbi:MAG TPA: DinB family protein [Bryobacteraceae bacterium]|jgi:uncharacterized damage-inducible protein DinB
MTHYGAKELAGAFRTVRNNTIKIAEEIGEEHYGFRATPATRSVQETLIHIFHIPDFPYEMHGVRKATSLAGFDFMGFITPRLADEKASRSKAEVLKMLADGRDLFANWLEGLPDDYLGESLNLPPGAQPATRTRFEMLMSVKEHEMHHRAQLMVIERMVGLTPHLTRQMEAMRAQMAAQQAQAAKP